MLKPGSYDYKFVLNNSEWVIEQNEPKRDDGKGNTNNYKVVLNENYASQHEEAKFSSKVFKNLRYIRKQINKYHQICAQEDASIFIHHQVGLLFLKNEEI